MSKSIQTTPPCPLPSVRPTPSQQFIEGEAIELKAKMRLRALVCAPIIAWALETLVLISVILNKEASQTTLLIIGGVIIGNILTGGCASVFMWALYSSRNEGINAKN